MDPREATTPVVSLPVGTVTLLLADVERSVRLWESDRTSMTDSVTRLDELTSEVIARHAGARPVEQGEGDSFVAAFARASDALACALELQLATKSEGWAGDITVRLRMAIHTGEVQLRDEGNYIGHAINRTARLRDIAHGGQTLLSRATHDLVVESLPEGVTLADHGTHRLRDLARPEHVFQLRHPDLDAAFPPLRSLDVVPNNLPLQMTSFIGRQSELAEVQRLIKETRLLTLTGSGGCGKTRLAMQLGADVLEDFRDGIWLADFGPISDPALVPKAVGEALGMPEEQYRDFVETLVSYVKARSLLIIFDNCEHLARACADFANLLLHRCPSVTVIATSREPLGIPGETPWRVPSLSFPTEDDRPAVEALGDYESVQLFVERALKTRPNFSITEENAGAVTQICQRLDGIPLAIELAAARVRLLPPQQICDGLADRFRLLTGGSRTLMPRQQTLQASVDWSFGLLSDPERMLLRRLSVFAGGFTLDAAEQVCAGDGVDAYQVLDLLSELVDRSLVQADEEDVKARYRLLETIRQYGRDRLVDAGEAIAVRGRHRDFYLALAERAEPEITGHGQDLWLTQLDAEHDNLRVALEWCSQESDVEALLRLAASLVFFWRYRGYVREADRWLKAALASADDAPPRLRAKALWGSSYMRTIEGDTSAGPVAEEALAIFRELEDTSSIARCVWMLGWEMIISAHDLGAEKLLRESEELARESGDEWCLGAALEGLGFLYLNHGRPSEARAFLEEALAVGRRSGDRFRICWVSTWLPWSQIMQGDLAEATPTLEDAVADLRKAKDVVFLGFALALLGTAHLYLGDYGKARDCLEESVVMGRQSESVTLPLTLAFAARVAQAQGDPDVARNLAREAQAMSSMPALLQGLAHDGLGRAELALGELADARMHLDEAVSICRDQGYRWALGMSLDARGTLHLTEGQHKQAESLLREALDVRTEIGDKVGVIDTLEGLAAVAATQESYTEAARLYGAAGAFRDAIGYVRFPSERDTYAAQVSAVRAALDTEAFEAAWNEGVAMSMAEAVAYAKRGRGERKRPSAGWDSLTPAEEEVVALVAQGLTNPQIGERLFISKRTVQTHLYRVFAKLGVSSRAELAAEAARRET